MNDLFEIVVLGVVQGIAEFLPISSDGHLVVVNAILEHLGGQVHADVLERTVALHAGTLLAVLVVYARNFMQALLQPRVLALLVIGTIPAVIFGLLADQFFKAWLEDELLAGIGLIVTGGLLLWLARARQGTSEYQELTLAQALRIGIFQAAAILPGVSRSGSTIASGIHTGLKRQDAATFSFLLSIPAVGGACTLEGLKMATATGAMETPLSTLAVGAVVSFVVGLAALLILLRILQAGRLHLFAYYCIPLGIAVVLWQLF